MTEYERHVPVLLNESLDFLNIFPSGAYFDATLGFGGHSKEILNRLDDSGLLVASDKDKTAFDFCVRKFAGKENIHLYRADYSDIDKIAAIEFIDKFDGILADLGVSSYQLDNPASGFTFRFDAPLDLRMDKSKGFGAARMLNTFSEEEIADIIYKFGEERNSRKIAKIITEKRKIKKISSSFDLKNIIAEITPERFLVKTLTRVFQALRIYVNDELEQLKEFLGKSTSLLKPGGRIVVISYHSLEDRIVKEHFKYEALSCVCPPELPVCMCGKESALKIITRKPVTPSEKEINENKRARSAKMRAAEKL